MSLIRLYQITDRDIQILEGVSYDPVAGRREELRRLLNSFHGAPVEEKFVVLCTKPHKEWIIGKMSGRGKPVKIIEGKKFRSLRRAECEVLKLFCKQHLTTRSV